MTDHPPPALPRPPPPIDLRTTTQILKQTAAIFSTVPHLLTFLLLSFLLLSLRSNVETATYSLTSFIDHDPSLKSLLSRLHLSSNPSTTTSSSSSSFPTSTNPRHHRRRSFLQLTRVGTLDDDFFSGDEELDHRFFGSVPKPLQNSTSFILDSFDPQLGFSSFVSDNGIRVSEVVRSNVRIYFKAIEKVEKEERIDSGSGNDAAATEGNETGSSFVSDFQLLLKKLELGQHDMTALLSLVGVLSASYGFVILGFVVTYAWVLGIIFVVVVNDLLNGYKSFFRTLWDGSNLGLKRLSGFICMRWAVRDALTQILGIWFFGEIEDHYSFFKIFVRLKLMPFSVMSPWVKGFEKESYGFLLSWFLLDTLVSFVFAVDAWVAMVDSRKTGREVVKEGCHLLALMLNPAINLKCLEGIVCGSFARWLLSRFFGKLFASAFQSIMEVYFMVAWLIYYFSVKSKDANASGMPFGRRELEGLLEGVR